MHTDEFYQAVYEHAATGFHTVLTLLAHTRHTALQKELSAQLEGYRRYVQLASDVLRNRGLPVKQEGLGRRLSVHVRMVLGTLLNRSPARIAKLTARASQASTLKLAQYCNSIQKSAGEGKETELCRAMLDFEDKNVRALRVYV